MRTRPAAQSTSQPTSQADLDRINRMLRSMATTVASLADRWLDEHGYEDINDYRAVIEKQLPKGFGLDHMTERPFGFVFHIGTNARYYMSAKAVRRGWDIQWRRVA